MDKGPLYLSALAAGLLLGLVLTRRWRPLLARRWRAMFLIYPALIVSVLPFLIWHVRPEWIWSHDRSYFISLVLLRTLLWSLFFCLNLLPARWFSEKPDSGLSWLQKISLLPVVIGLFGEAAVLVLNQGFWPVSEAILTESVTPAFAAGIRNNAYVFLRIIDQQTRLPWLAQIIPCPFLHAHHLTLLPSISPAEILTSAGLFFIGLTQFLAPDLPKEPAEDT